MSENYIQYVNAAINGDTDAMAKLYSRTLKASYFLAVTLCGNKQDAAEITKKAYARAFCTIDKLKRPEAFEIWMKQNVAAVYRETQRFIFADADAGAVENSSEFLSENVLEDEELSAKIIAGVTSLRPELKTALVLHYNNGMPVQALAKFLGVSESTANALLGKARACVLESADIDASAVAPSASLPVITRLFQRNASNIAIDNVDVRDIFIYAIDAYEASKPAQPVIEEIKTVAEEVKTEEKIEEDISEEESEVTHTDETAEEEISEVPETPADNIVMFKQKINEMLGAENVLSDESSVESKETVAEEDDDSVNVPDIPVSQGVSDDVLDKFDDTSAETENNLPIDEKKKFDLKKIDFKKINPKIIIIAVAALLVLVLAIGGISKLAGGNDPESGITQEDSAYKWQAGGFSECAEIGYLNENAAYFKSVTTGKYGLIDYRGNVILQPNYDGFENCGSGRDYDNSGKYHSLVTIDNQKFELSIVNGIVTIAQDAHTYHSISTDELEGKKYDERDRYFEGYAAARKDDKWGYVSEEKDKKVIPYEYEAVNEISGADDSTMDYCRPVTSSGLIPVKKDGKMGIIDLDNDVVVPFEFSNIMPGNNGVFIACKDGIWGVILTGDAKSTFKGVNLVVSVTPPEVSEPAEENTLGKYKVTDEDGANVRDGAGSDYDILGELDYGDIVVGYDTKRADNGNKWLKIKINGEYGWVSMNMLEKE